MKKTILLSSILAVGAAFADVKTTTIDINTVGVMGISMPSSVQLVAVPFLGWNADAITINDMINTAELNVGSKLYAPSGEDKYNIWQLTKGAGNSKVWTKLEHEYVIDDKGAAKETETTSADVSVMSRGGAYWLEPTGGSGTHFYLVGRPADVAGSSSLEADKWNLIGNTSGVAKEFPHAYGVKDEIICVPNGNGGLTRYTYVERSSCVGWVKTGERAKTNDTIQHGQGIWYFSKTSKSITW